MQEKERIFLDNYDAHADALFRFAYFQVSDKEIATDLVQDTFLETWNYLAKNEEGIENIKAFLYHVLRNKVIDHYRKHKTRSLDEITENGKDFPDDKTSAVIEIQAEVSNTLRLLEKMDDKYKEPVLLRYIEGLGVKEIAGIIGETESNTSVLIHRGLEQLRNLAHI